LQFNIHIHTFLMGKKNLYDFMSSIFLTLWCYPAGMLPIVTNNELVSRFSINLFYPKIRKAEGYSSAFNGLLFFN